MKPFAGQKVTPIYGIPGAGKTTRLVSMIQELIAGGHKPEQIAFCSLTNVAANEGRRRVANKLQIKQSALPYFSTVHSLSCKNVPGQMQVMEAEHYIEAAPGFRFNTVPEGFRLDGDLCQEIWGRQRAMLLDHPAELLEADPDILDEMQRMNVSLPDLEDFIEQVSNFKARTGMLDFTDQLQAGVTGPSFDNIRTAFIDEAQDCSLLQWKAADNLFRNAEHVVIAGDDDQAIFDYSGAASSVFRAMGDYPTVVKLEQSYRCPTSVFDLARKIISQVEDRVPKRVLPRDAAGEVSELSDLQELDQALESGEWLFLVRQKKHMEEIETYLKSREFVYWKSVDRSISASGFVCSLHKKTRTLSRAYTRLKAGSPLKLETTKDLLRHLSVRKGFLARGIKSSLSEKLERTGKEELTLDDLLELGYVNAEPFGEHEWYDALVEVRDIDYARGVLSAGHDLEERRIKISTVHAAKGTEAENVVVNVRSGYLTRLALDAGTPDEFRVAYVAVTRAKEKLWLYVPPVDSVTRDINEIYLDAHFWG